MSKRSITASVGDASKRDICFVKKPCVLYVHAYLKTEEVRIRGGGRVSWDKVREWHGHIYTTKHKIDS